MLTAGYDKTPAIARLDEESAKIALLPSVENDF